MGTENVCGVFYLRILAVLVSSNPTFEMRHSISSVRNLFLLNFKPCQPTTLNPLKFLRS